VALAEGLRSAGHEVTLTMTCVDQDCRDTYDRVHGVRVEAVASPVIGDRAALQGIEAEIFGEPDPLRQTRIIVEKLFLHASCLPMERTIADELQAFVSQGEPPVYMTFGSAMSGGDPEEAIGLLRAAADRAAVRAVIQAPSWRDLGLRPDGRIHYVDAAPHAAIFPSCRAIVHHGGAGTTHAALLAGKPSIVVAHTSEQAFWGRELARHTGLTPARLARQIAVVTGSAEIHETAAELGRAMAREDGVATAVRLIGDKARCLEPSVGVA
jgi:UDP:flavonoid glycosyltransferase YjiC (YdhE family)